MSDPTHYTRQQPHPYAENYQDYKQQRDSYDDPTNFMASNRTGGDPDPYYLMNRR